MAEYRLYCMDGLGHIHHAEPLEAADDQEAIRKAHDLKLHAVKCEVWHRDRLVATLNSQDLAG